LAKAFHFGSVGRLRMMAGANLLADAVQITLGPHGRNVLIEHRTGGMAPVLTRDGITVARSIEDGDSARNMGIAMLREAARNVSREAGDGTSTTIVLARRIAAEAVKAMAAGLGPKGLRQGIGMAISAVIADLECRARKCTCGPALASLGTIAANGEEHIGTMLAEVFERVGSEGIVVLEPGEGRDDKLEFAEGASWGQGYPSRYFVTNKDRETAELDNPFVLLTDRAIARFDELIPALDLVREENGTLLIVAESIEERALPPLLLNHIRGIIRAVPVKPPGYGDTRAHALADLAVLTGGRAILESCGDSLDRLRLADLGRAKRAVVTENSISIMGGAGETGAIAGRAASIEQQIGWIRNGDPAKGSAIGKSHDQEQLEERLRRLSGVAAVIRVGGSADVEIKERLQRFENAMNSMRGALREGILPGGGTALLRAGEALRDLPRGSQDVRCGIDIVARAIAEPARLISANMGADATQALARILGDGNPFFGLDARRGQFGDLYELGVLDPLTATRLALREAASAASQLMTAECVITQIPPEDPLYGYTPEWAAATREDPRA
jgi:chaperonin GroEL